MDDSAHPLPKQDAQAAKMYSACEYSSGMVGKSERIQLRVSSRDKDVLTAAAETKGVSLSEFITSTGVAEAEVVLADRTQVLLNQKDWMEFVRFLNSPPKKNERLARLLASERPS